MGLILRSEAVPCFYPPAAASAVLQLNCWADAACFYHSCLGSPWGLGQAVPALDLQGNTLLQLDRHASDTGPTPQEASPSSRGHTHPATAPTWAWAPRAPRSLHSSWCGGCSVPPGGVGGVSPHP